MSRTPSASVLRRALTAITATAALVLGGLVVGAAPASAEEGYGTIQGQLGTEGGAVQTQVTLYAFSPRYQNWQPTGYGAYAIGGNYQLMPEPGEYRVCAALLEPSPFAVPPRGAAPQCFGGPDPQSATTIHLGDGETFTADMWMYELTKIAGTVYGEDDFGDPVPAPGSSVFVYRYVDGEWQQVWGAVPVDAEGGYVAYVPSGGEYILCAVPAPSWSGRLRDCTGGGPWIENAMAYGVPTGGSLQGIDLTMPWGGMFGGVITGDGHPLPGVTVKARAQHWSGGVLEYTTISIEDGQYWFEGIPSASYQLCFSDSTFAAGGFLEECYDDGDLFEVDIAQPWRFDYDIDLSLGGRIGGTVKNTSGGTPNFTKAILYRDLGGTWTRVAEQTTNLFGGGSFGFGPLEPGTYRVCGETTQLTLDNRCWQDAATVDTATDIDLGAGDDATGHNIVLPFRTMATVSGDISFVGDPQSEEPYGEVSAWVEDGDAWKRVAITNVASDLTFSMEIPEGEYRFCARVPEQTWAPVCWGGWVVEDALDVTVTAAEPTVLGFEFVAGGWITGQITNTLGNGLQDTAARVFFQSESGEYVPIRNTIPNGVADFNGYYAIAPLAPGSYLVEFVDESASGPHYVSEYYDDAVELENAELVTVVAGDATVIDAVLRAEGEVIVGTVAVTGVPQVGNTLTVSVGGWLPAPDDWEYQWYTEEDGLIEGADSAFLYLGNDFAERSIYVVASAIYPGSVEQAESDVLYIHPAFADVPNAHVFSTEILWMRDAGISGGYFDEDGIRTFRPFDSVQRQAVAAFLYRLAGSPAFELPSEPSFSDVALDQPFALEIEWMRAEGITVGNADGTFGPTDAVTRQAMAAFLYRFAGRPEFEAPSTPSFTDLPYGAPFYDEVEWLIAEGITVGYPDGELWAYHPLEDVSRQAMAAFLYRMAHAAE